MIKYTRFLLLFLLAAIAFQAKSQSTATSSSPYSRYGLGDISPLTLTQNRAMGGIATAINRINVFNSINPLNPASYSAINLTTFDIGLNTNVLSLSQTGQVTQSNSNFKLSNINFAIPVSHTSALSFGLMPYSELGYNYRQTLTGFGTGSSVDTATVNYLYKGEGALSKAYAGYGFSIGRHLALGGNISYIFGDLKHTQSTEIPIFGVLNSSIEQDNSIGGLNYDYGAQYTIDLSLTRHIVLGYSASASSQINSKGSFIVSQYTADGAGNANVAADSVINRQNAISKIQLPQINHFGISYQKDEKYLFGADYSIGNWSDLTIGGTNQGLKNSNTLNVGGQFTPNLNAVNNYWATVDYRFGFIYDQTYLKLNNTNINSYAVTFGFGLPLAGGGNGSFYKINISGEVGKRGALSNGLVRENFFNFHLSFLLNDTWFRKYQFD